MATLLGEDRTAPRSSSVKPPSGPTRITAGPGANAVPDGSPEKRKAVERLVDRVLLAKQRDAKADVSALEREIDELVYALYGLTPEEIQIVEGAAK